MGIHYQRTAGVLPIQPPLFALFQLAPALCLCISVCHCRKDLANVRHIFCARPFKVHLHAVPWKQGDNDPSFVMFEGRNGAPPNRFR